MANGPIDALGAALFTFAAGSSLGIADVELGTFQLSDVAVTVAGYSITWAMIVAIGTLTLAWFLNEPDWNRFSDEQQVLVGITVALVVLGTVTSLDTIIGDSFLIALAVVGIEAGGYWAIAQAS